MKNYHGVNTIKNNEKTILKDTFLLLSTELKFLVFLLKPIVNPTMQTLLQNVLR